MVAGHITRVAALDLPGRVGKDVPNRRTPSAFGGGALDLITGRSRSPKERFCEGSDIAKGLFEA